ncbi:MAG TPA: thiol-disulfide oxidoreductase [Flavobacteriaceae bacterium]|nr:thiol-disulfide oxidoreductase [Flavobacteriaceae bacterium]|tara:strand:+ start:320414 stop:320974 length:561 start_codon:yes stop_codon:yes gene_type:complete
MVPFKKHGSTILLLVLVALLFIPQTGMPIKVFFNRLISFSPSEINVEKRETIHNFDWQLEDLEGTNINFNQSEGKVTLVNFWATWCPPCVAEMPSLQNLYDEYRGAVDFYFVSLESPETLEKFIQKKGYRLPIYIPQEQLPDGLETNSFPTTYLISKNGEIVIDKVGAADWDSEKTKAIIEKLLAE